MLIDLLAEIIEAFMDVFFSGKSSRRRRKRR